MRITVVDAFTDRAFRGNPAAVAILDSFPPAAEMQDIASEMNLSETAFAVGRAGGDHDLRWFTPTTEVNLCGHATLATAHVLGGAGRFHTHSGVLTCSAASGGWIEMDFPALQPEERVLPSPVKDLPLPSWTGIAGEDWLVELPAPADVESLVPDLAGMAALGRRCFIVTARVDRGGAGGGGSDRDSDSDSGGSGSGGDGDGGIDVVSRVFAPNAGIAEDPVTGSAHCALAAYWAPKLGRPDLVGYQASKRGGTVRMRLEGGRVTLGGRAITISEVNLVASGATR